MNSELLVQLDSLSSAQFPEQGGWTFIKLHEQTDNAQKEYVSLLIGLYKNNGSVLHVAIRLLFI